MPRGLSELQKTILLLAMKGKAGVTNQDVLVACYGFEKSRPGGCPFDKEKIGASKYNSSSVAVAKAFNRLVARGLLKRRIAPYFGGYALTPAGREELKRMTANG